MTTATQTTTLLTVPAADLYNALGNAIHFASNDKDLPILRSVNLQYSAKTKSLVARATDRYKMVYIKIADGLDSDAESFNVTISRDRVKDLVARLRDWKKFYDPDLQLEFFDNRLEMIYYASGAELIESAPLVEGEYPNISNLVRGAFKHDAVGAEPGGQFMLTTRWQNEHIEAVTKLKDLRLTPSKRRHNQDALEFGFKSGPKPLTFTYSGWAIGLVMPIRVGDKGGQLANLTEAPAWID